MDRFLQPSRRLRSSARYWRGFVFVVGAIISAAWAWVAWVVATDGGRTSDIDWGEFLRVFLPVYVAVALFVGLYILLAGILEGVTLVADSVAELAETLRGRTEATPGNMDAQTPRPTDARSGRATAARQASEAARRVFKQPVAQSTPDPTRKPEPRPAKPERRHPSTAIVTAENGAEAWSDPGRLHPIYEAGGTPPLPRGVTVEVRSVAGEMTLVRAPGWSDNIWVRTADLQFGDG